MLLRDGILTKIQAALKRIVMTFENCRGKQCNMKIIPNLTLMWKISTGWITHTFDSAVGGLQECPRSPVPPTARQLWLQFGCHEGARNGINSLSAEKLDRQCQTEAGITSRVCVCMCHMVPLYLKMTDWSVKRTLPQLLHQAS